MISFENSTHIAFSDESGWNTGRFGAISMISMQIDSYNRLKEELDNIISKKNSELKWVNISKRIGKELIDFTYENLDNMRVDTVIWDIEDSRNKGVKGRDDEANFRRMYYHLMFFVLSKMWPPDAIWAFVPDHHEAIDWSLQRNILYNARKKKRERDRLKGPKNSSGEYFRDVVIKPDCSKNHGFIQLADFFAGIACYSYQKCDLIENYSSSLEQSIDTSHVAKRDIERIPLVHYIVEKSQEHKRGVYLRHQLGLRTDSPKKPLNFWLYRPQHDLDKAPQIKNRRAQRKKS